MSQGIVYTIGYQGRSIDEFVTSLVKEEVQVLCDVRRKALSRKKGFSKRALSEALEAAGIEYVHMPELGMPTDLLPERSTKDNSPILMKYQQRVPPSESERVEHLALRASSSRVCLLCFEESHDQCHRGVLASVLESEWKCEIFHI